MKLCIDVRPFLKKKNDVLFQVPFIIYLLLKDRGRFNFLDQLLSKYSRPKVGQNDTLVWGKVPKIRVDQ